MLGSIGKDIFALAFSSVPGAAESSGLNLMKSRFSRDLFLSVEGGGSSKRRRMGKFDVDAPALQIGQAQPRPLGHPIYNTSSCTRK